MATATNPTSQPAAPAPNDPTHDVNGRAVVAWVLAWTAVLFLGMYGLLILFDQVLSRNRTAKIEGLPNRQLQQQLQLEQAFLRGELPGGRQGRSIEQTLQEMAGR